MGLGSFGKTIKHIAQLSHSIPRWKLEQRLAILTRYPFLGPALQRTANLPPFPALPLSHLDGYRTSLSEPGRRNRQIPFNPLDPNKLPIFSALVSGLRQTHRRFRLPVGHFCPTLVL